MVREGFCGQMIFEQRLAKSEEVRHAGWQRASRAEGTANARTLRIDHAQHLGDSKIASVLEPTEQQRVWELSLEMVEGG